jgi:transcriptional regulator with XRE-family HTH domain
MHATVRRMKLETLLRQHGIPTIREFAHRMGFKRQQAWDLWHERVGVGAAMMKRLHETLEIPLEELVQLDPVPWKKRPKPKEQEQKSRRSPRQAVKSRRPRR